MIFLLPFQYNYAIFTHVSNRKVGQKMTAQKKVIIVEDDRETAEMLAEMIRVSGFEPVVFVYSILARDSISMYNPVFIILDILMPEKSGLELLKVIRADAGLAKIPVILVSALSTGMDIKTGMAAGAAAYLTKPVAFFELKKVIEKIMTAV